jgi:competence protein ComEA
MAHEPRENRHLPHWLLRRGDQVAVAGLVLVGLATLAAWYTVQGGWQGRLIEREQAAPQSVQLQVDLNAAQWPELTQLPGIGETLARRIVETRQQEGPFSAPEDLRRVRGIGRKTLERIRPYLAPLPSEPPPDSSAKP